MKNLLITLALLIGFTATTQNHWQKKDPAHYFYSSLTVDANKLLGLKDNPRTKVDNRGFDWDLEAGIRADNFGVYAFYGRFDKIDYQTYGAGADYYGQWLRDFEVEFLGVKLYDGIEFVAGLYYSEVIRKDSDGHYGSFTSWLSPKGRIIFWNGNIGYGVNVKGQGRGELGKRVWEGGIELIIKWDRT